MSDSEKPRRPDGQNKPRKPHFEVREQSDKTRQPRPFDRTRDPFGGLADVELGPRTSTTALSSRAQPKTPLIVQAPVSDEVAPPRLPPPARTRDDVELADLLDIPAPRYRASARSVAAPPSAGGSPLLLLVLVSAACVVVIYLLWLQPAETRLSDFTDRFGEAQAAEAQDDPLAYPRLPTPPGQNSVVGPPSIDANAIEAILASYGSPAAGTGATWVALGREFGIDPAYAVAFFIHESSAGTAAGWAGNKPDGTTTHNVGNIICAGYPTCFGRFRDYPNWETGIRDWYKLIKVEYIEGRGAHTVEQIIPIYAPSFENNVPAYVNVVNGLVADWRRGVR